MDNLGYLFAAYTIVWIGLCYLAWTAIKKQKNNEKEIEILKEKLSEKK